MTPPSPHRLGRLTDRAFSACQGDPGLPPEVTRLDGALDAAELDHQLVHTYTGWVLEVGGRRYLWRDGVGPGIDPEWRSILSAAVVRRHVELWPDGIMRDPPWRRVCSGYQLPVPPPIDPDDPSSTVASAP